MHDEIIHGNLGSLRGSDMIVYGDNRIALIEKQSTIRHLKPIRVEMLLSVLCLNGNATFILDGKQYEIHKNHISTLI